MFGDILSTGLAVGGDLFGTGLAAHYNAKEASKNRGFQAWMSGTAYQRAAKDLEKAGLNRILALGNPATTPSGSAASINAPQLGRTGIAAAEAKAGIASAKQAIEESKARENLAKVDADARKIGMELTGAQILKTLEETRSVRTQAERDEAWRAFYPVLNDVFDSLLKGNEDVGTQFGEWLKKKLGIGGSVKDVTAPIKQPGTPPGGQRQYRRRR